MGDGPMDALKTMQCNAMHGHGFTICQWTWTVIPAFFHRSPQPFHSSTSKSPLTDHAEQYWSSEASASSPNPKSCMNNAETCQNSGEISGFPRSQTLIQFPEIPWVCEPSKPCEGPDSPFNVNDIARQTGPISPSVYDSAAIGWNNRSFQDGSTKRAKFDLKTHRQNERRVLGVGTFVSTASSTNSRGILAYLGISWYMLLSYSPKSVSHHAESLIIDDLYHDFHDPSSPLKDTHHF